MTGLAAGLLSVAVPTAAHAASFDYRGGCYFVALNDTTPTGQLGGEERWNGVIVDFFVITDTSGTPSGQIGTARCDLYVNGVFQSTVLGPDSGSVIVSQPRLIPYTAAVTDVVSVCEVVTIPGDSIKRCTDATTTQLTPQPIIDALDLVANLLGDIVSNFLDPTACLALVALSPVVDSTFNPGFLWIDPSWGDVWFGGRRVKDCPPYDTGTSLPEALYQEIEAILPL
jgi:hypothetical protein